MSQPRAGHPYIVNPTYDWALFLLPPLGALLAGIAISETAFTNSEFAVRGVDMTGASVLMGIVVHAHLVAVVFRSHANAAIFRQFRWRFTVVPAVLFLAIVASTWVAITATVVATFWDVWHSGAQTFGFGRIYDRNAGAPPDRGRRLDFALNQLLYAGPILAGATLMDHVDSFEDYDTVGSVFFTAIPAHVEGVQGTLAWVVLVGGALFLAYYLLAYWRMYRDGYTISPLKVYLVASTGLCSIYSWGLNSWGEAFFIMNLFHAVQYLAIVWATEQKRMLKLFRVDGRRHGRVVAGVLFLGLVGLYGGVAQFLDSDFETLWALTIVVSLMHFWYDGFVWSVRKSEV